MDRGTAGSGNVWTWCALGHRHWGRYGAAGLMLSHRDEDDVEWILLQQRGRNTQHPETWGLLGGARRAGDTSAMTARREAEEESTVGRDLDVQISLVDGRVAPIVDDHGGWAYSTVLATADRAPRVYPKGPESREIQWVRSDLVADLKLHPGFAATWSQLNGSTAA